MSVANELFVVDAAGNRNAVLLDMDRYRELTDAEEELECIRAFDDAKSASDETVPFSQAVKEFRFFTSVIDEIFIRKINE